MKGIILAVLFLGSLAHASGELVGGMTYLDDVNQSLAPTLGIKCDSKLLGLDFVSYVGGGVIQQPVGSTAQNTFARLALDVGYAGLAKGLKVGLGGALESAKATYHSFDDYVHVTASYELW